jgi:predicted DsbA family dithiol-disulfide isomerase
LVHFPLHSDTPQKGRTLADMFGPGKDIATMNANMKKLMEQEGLPYGARTMTYNSRLAQELGSWADTQDRGEAFHQKIYQAYFVENKNIGDTDVLVSIAESVGLGGNEAHKIIQDRTFKEAVDKDWGKAHEVGVTGVPTFVANGSGVVGAQPYEALEQLVQNAGARKK